MKKKQEVRHWQEKHKDFAWPLCDGVLEEWHMTTFTEIRGKKVVVKREVEFIERKLTRLERMKDWAIEKLSWRNRR